MSSIRPTKETSTTESARAKRARSAQPFEVAIVQNTGDIKGLTEAQYAKDALIRDAVSRLAKLLGRISAHHIVASSTEVAGDPA